MLTALESDNLPKFEKRFKDLLNENTIREVASFQSRRISMIRRFSSQALSSRKRRNSSTRASTAGAAKWRTA